MSDSAAPTDLGAQHVLKKYGFAPETFMTDDLRSYSAAARDFGMERRHRTGRWRKQPG